MKGETEVRRRINLLDGAPPGATIDSTLVGNLTRVIRLAEQITNTWWQPEASEPPVISPETADRILAECETISRISEMAPAFASGPLALDEQVWTGASDNPQLKRYRPRQIELAEQYFFPLSRSKAELRPKPRDGGLFTCTLLPETTDTMWLLYQEPYGGRNTLFPKPWYTYRTGVRKGARVYEATSASQWASLVNHYALHGNELLYPDWKRIADDYDAIHVTVPAIVAMQGLRLTTAKGTIADVYWDVEQTLWLNWSFTNVHLIQS